MTFFSLFPVLYLYEYVSVYGDKLNVFDTYIDQHITQNPNRAINIGQLQGDNTILY